jgi:hypothetical protein
VTPAAGDGPIAHITLIPTNVTLDHLPMTMRLSQRKLSLMRWRAKRRPKIIISAMRCAPKR